MPKDRRLAPCRSRLTDAATSQHLPLNHAVGRAVHVLVILSNKYLKSIACMTELHHIYNRAKEDQQAFVDRIILVVLDEVRMSQPEERALHQRDWRERVATLRELVVAGDLGSADRGLITRINRWQLVTADMLSWLNDDLTPRTWEAIESDDFAAVRALLPPVRPANG